VGQLKEFAKHQAIPEKAIHCNRPRHATDPIPVTLHPVFGKFFDNIDMRKPTDVFHGNGKILYR
jgi:hypothetical protein